jgi:adenosylcobinamide-phosphate synthase
MSFLAVLMALILEQARPLTQGSAVLAAPRSWVRMAGRNLDAGLVHHGWLAWSVAVLVPSLLALALHHLLWWVNPILAFVWNVAVLYLTLGFRQFSHHFTNIRDALELGDEEQARAALARWQRVDASSLPRSEIVRHVIEHSVLAAHRHVFGVLSWFSVLAAFGLGPAGAVIYRLGDYAYRYWSHKSTQPGEGVSPALAAASSQAWGLIDYLPSRMTAMAFAVVGSFEDAVDSWRQCHAQMAAADLTRVQRNEAIVVAATAGAVNVQLGGSPLRAAAPELSQSQAPTVPPSAGGRPPEPVHLRSVVGLVWRAVVLWIVLLALLTLARLLG